MQFEPDGFILAIRAGSSTSIGVREGFTQIQSGSYVQWRENLPPIEPTCQALLYRAGVFWRRPGGFAWATNPRGTYPSLKSTVIHGADKNDLLTGVMRQTTLFLSSVPYFSVMIPTTLTGLYHSLPQGRISQGSTWNGTSLSLASPIKGGYDQPLHSTEEPFQVSLGGGRIIQDPRLERLPGYYRVHENRTR